ncbi:DUF3313 domain-containing protein [Parashewanella spongiae]|nr:DUF3313 domain-containing protein [Parashewanella spongiae]MCL1079788.1 DUF3313 domain-containing protein [Parashewanella spongiae]
MTAACSSKPDFSKVENGFLPNYQNLTEIKNDNDVTQYYWASHKLNRVFKPIEPENIYINPVIYYPKLAMHSQITQENADKIKAFIDQKINMTVSRYFPVTDTIDERTFVLSPAITQIIISPEGISPLEVLPVGAAIGTLKYLTGIRDEDVEIRFETKVTLANTNTLLATTVFNDEAEQLENDTEQLSNTHTMTIIDSWMKQLDSQLSNYKALIDKRHQQ